MRLTRAQTETASEWLHGLAARPENFGHKHVALAALAAYENVAEVVDELECEYGDGCPDFGSQHGRCTPCKLRRALEG